MHWLVLAFVLVFWIGVVWNPGGWRHLAERFRAPTSIGGKRFWFVTGAIFRPGWAWMNYGGCLTATVNHQGFGLSVWFICGLKSPPLFIPWPAIESVSPKQFLWAKTVTVHLKDDGHRIRIYGKAGQAVWDAWQQQPGRFA